MNEEWENKKQEIVQEYFFPLGVATVIGLLATLFSGNPVYLGGMILLPLTIWITAYTGTKCADVMYGFKRKHFGGDSSGSDTSNE